MGSNRNFLPYGKHTIDDDDVAAVVDVLRSDFLTAGPGVERFEETFSRIVGGVPAAVCANGTAALHLASLALGIGQADIVIVPSITFLATASAPHLLGANVVFSDVDPHSGLITAETLQAAFERAKTKVKAVFPVHLNGNPADLASLAEVAHAHGAAMVEDACHALGGSYRGQPIGSGAYSDLATFSFHPVKAVAMGEGGVVTGKDPDLIERVRLFRSHGMVRDSSSFLQPDMAFDKDGNLNPWYYEMPQPAFNYRASEINCALGLSQLNKLQAFIARRAELAARYDELLEPYNDMVRPVARTHASVSGWHLYAVLIDFDKLAITKARLMYSLRERGIGTQVHYIPVHLQPYWRRTQKNFMLPGAERYYKMCLSLPLYPAMSDDDVFYVATQLFGVLGLER